MMPSYAHKYRSCARPDGRPRSGRSQRGAEGAAGFTLVELVIALSLITLIMLLLFSGLRLGSRAWEGVEGLTDRHAEQRIARSFFERSLREARMVTIRVGDRNRSVFAGDAQRIELVTPLSEGVGIGGLYLLRFSLQAVGEGPALVVTRWLLHPDVLDGSDEIPAWEPLRTAEVVAASDAALEMDLAVGAYGKTVLLTDVESLEIAYFGLAPGGDEPEWRDEWIDQPVPPQLVSVRATTGRGAWLDLSVSMPQGR